MVAMATETETQEVEWRGLWRDVTRDTLLRVLSFVCDGNASVIIYGSCVNDKQAAVVLKSYHNYHRITMGTKVNCVLIVDCAF